ncbi:actin-related protein 2/3 complex subunit 5-like protein [Paramacrobiotus metropolitanus]|uniref:actin-related protein 2/3 complex subunit 5-like protein n=1 Tax=Paramacrobiotus metropolitanus TaxID=2943436 RepID=UPI002445DF5A|nr:actin-related protein 2/3 complex subunit 5-like protein [Paramacrobiotus metropolitanus]
MAKNTISSSFRGIDVDQYGEDVYKDDEAAAGDPSSPGPDETEINNLLVQGKHVEALKVALAKAPYNTKQQAVKDRAMQSILRIMTGIKSSDVDAALQSMPNLDHIDTLMKYIYRGFEYPQHSLMLLNWHEKVFAIGGVGSVVRVLTDKRRL